MKPKAIASLEPSARAARPRQGELGHPPPGVLAVVDGIRLIGRSIWHKPTLPDAMSQRFDREDLRLAGPALRAFTQIASAWSLSPQEQSQILGQPVESAFAVLETGVTDPSWPETLQRVSYLIGIYRLLHTIFSDSQQANGWVRRPNNSKIFNGNSALALMCSGHAADLAQVRQHLETDGLY